MREALLVLAVAPFLGGCATTEVTDESIAAAADQLDFGDSSSVTLATKSWEALAAKNYPELFAYTQRCVELYGEQGKRMDAALTDFEPPETAAKQWALNDVGTCLFIMANAYEKLEMYPEATRAYETLARDFQYS